ncbi:MAG: hypothetical protein ACRDJ4_03705 [Actinomycetota bacterium]
MTCSRRLIAALAGLALAAAACTGSGGGGKKTASPSALAAGPLYRGETIDGTPHPLGMKWEWPRSDELAPYLRRLSGGASFYEMEWCDVEPSRGQREWGTVDQVADAAHRLGYALHLKIRTGSCWVNADRGGHERGRKAASAMPDSLGTYEEFVRAVVERYAPKDVHTYAIENEVNGESFWNGSADEYERLVRAAAAAIHKADPQARVFDAGISSTGHGSGVVARLNEGSPDAALAAYRRYYGQRGNRRRDFPEATDAESLRAALATEQARRNLSFLATTEKLLADGVVDGRQVHFYEPAAALPDLIAYLQATTPKHVPIEAWEVGMFWTGGAPDDQVQAADTVKKVSLLLGAGVTRVIWLPLSASPGGRRNSEIRFGLLDPKGAVRPAGEAFEALATAASGGAGWREVAGAGVEGIAIGRTDASTLVLWSESPRVLRHPPPAGARATVAGGGDLRWEQSGLTIGPQPVILQVSTGLDAALRLLA